MKTKHLIKILEAADPESEVGAQIGSDNEQTYRDLCAMAELAGGECLSYLEVSEARIYEENGKTLVSLTLQQWNYSDLEDAAADFDKEYTKVRKQPDTIGHTEPAWGDDSECIYTDLVHWLRTNEPLSMERQTMIAEWLKKIRGKLIGG